LILAGGLVEFDLKRQINRAAVSMPSNIAEGWKRKRRRMAYQNHVSIAMGSHAELETQLEICFRNHLLDPLKCQPGGHAAESNRQANRTLARFFGLR